MKKRIFPLALMAATALTLTLAACDDAGTDQTAAPAEETQMMTTPETIAVVAESQMPAPAAQAQLISASGATAFATVEGMRTGAIFMTLSNAGSVADRLVGAKTDKAAMVEIHEGFVDETTGTMQMRKIDGLDVSPGTPVELKAGGYHLMLLDLAAPLVPGETFTVTLDFDMAEDVVVPVTVTAPNAAAPMDHSAHGTSTTTGNTPPAPAMTDPAATLAPSAPITPTDEPAPADQPMGDEQVAP